MLLYLKHTKDFTTNILDEILIQGDELYHTIVSNLQMSGKFKSYLLQFEELPSTVQLLSYSVLKW